MTEASRRELTIEELNAASGGAYEAPYVQTSAQKQGQIAPTNGGSLLDAAVGGVAAVIKLLG